MLYYLSALLGFVRFLLLYVIQNVGLVTAAVLYVVVVTFDDVVAYDAWNILYAARHHNDGVTVDMDILAAAQAPDRGAMLQRFLTFCAVSDDCKFHREFDLLFLAHGISFLSASTCIRRRLQDELRSISRISGTIHCGSRSTHVAASSLTREVALCGLLDARTYKLPSLLALAS